MQVGRQIFEEEGFGRLGRIVTQMINYLSPAFHPTSGIECHPMRPTPDSHCRPQSLELSINQAQATNGIFPAVSLVYDTGKSTCQGLINQKGSAFRLSG